MFKSRYHAARYYNAAYYGSNAVVVEDVAYLQLYINGSGYGVLAMERLATYGTSKRGVPKDSFVTFRA